MAKVEPGLVNIKGKFHDNIIAKGSRKESFTRKPVEPGTKKNEPALKNQYTRTSILNALASQINISIKEHGGSLRSSSFYQEVLRRFRKADTDNRYLLLMQLRGKEVNENYVYSRFHQPAINCLVSKDSVIVNLMTDSHPRQDKYETNCYYYKILLMQWRISGECEAASQLGEWIFNDGGLPEFDFQFPRVPDMQQWLVAIKLCLGKDKKELGLMSTEAMKIVEVGTVVKKDLELAKLAKMEMAKKVVRRTEKELVRVKAKRVV